MPSPSLFHCVVLFIQIYDKGIGVEHNLYYNLLFLVENCVVPQGMEKIVDYIKIRYHICLWDTDNGG